MIVHLALGSVVSASMAVAAVVPLPPLTPPLNLTAGRATLTHYDLPLDYVASCGCVARSTHYPTAAVNVLAFGSNIAFGSACGRCYKINLVSTPGSPLPPDGDGMEYAPDDRKAPSVVVKITDSCPSGTWCSQTQTIVDEGNGKTSIKATPNTLGSMMHFDLAWPSTSIPKDFYPLDAQHNDYGVWWVEYSSVSCTAWAGYRDPAAWGSDWLQQGAACCPVDPLTNVTESLDTAAVESAVDGLPLSIDRSAQRILCPSYVDAQKDNLLIPNTSNILSENHRQTSSALASAHSPLAALFRGMRVGLPFLPAAFSRTEQAVLLVSNGSESQKQQDQR